MVRYGDYIDPEQQVEEEEFGWGDVPEDILRGVGTGIIGFGESLASLATLGTVEFEKNFGLFDGPQGTIGGLVDGFVQVGLGYLTGGAALKGLSSVARYGNMAKTAKALDVLQKPGQLATVGQRFGAETVRGAMADFIAFEGSEERLSNDLQNIPGLGFTEYLANDSNESELEGRLKNVLEGAGLGMITFSLQEVWRGLKKSRRAAAAANEKARKAANEEVRKAEEKVREDLRNHRADSQVSREKYRDENQTQLGDVMSRWSNEYDPAGGEVIIARDVLGEDVTVRGTTRLSEVDIEGDAQASYGVYQLRNDARVLKVRVDSTRPTMSKEAFELLGGTYRRVSKGKNKGKRVRNKLEGTWEEQMSRLEKIVKENDYYDAISNNHEVTIINPKAIGAKVRALPGDPFFESRARYESNVWSRLPKSVTANTPMLNMIRRMNINEEEVLQVADDLDMMMKMDPESKEVAANVQKLPGRLNVSKLSGQDVQILHMLRQQAYEGLEVKKKAKPGEKGLKAQDVMNEEAMQEMSKMLGRPLSEVSRLIEDDIENLHNIAIRWQSGKGVIQAYSQELLKMKQIAAKYKRSGLGNLTPEELKLLESVNAEGKNVTLTASEWAEKIARMEQDLHVFSELNGFTGLQFGQGLGRGRFGVDTWDQARLAEVVGSKNESHYRNLLDRYESQVDLAGDDHALVSELTAKSRNGVGKHLLHYLYFSILSAPKTFVTNLMGIAGTSTTKPMESWLGGLVRKGLRGFQEAAEIDDAMRMATKEFRFTAQAARDLLRSVFGRKGASLSSAIGPDGTAKSISAGDHVRRAARNPNSSLTGNAAWLEHDNTGAVIQANQYGDQSLYHQVTNAPTYGMRFADEFTKTTLFIGRLKTELGEQWDRLQAKVDADPTGEEGLKIAERMRRSVSKEHWVDSELQTFMAQDHIATKEALYHEAARAHPHRAYQSVVERHKAITKYVRNRLDYGVAAGDHGRVLVQDREAIANRLADGLQTDTFTTPLSKMADEKSELKYVPRLLAVGGHYAQKMTTRFPMMKLVLPFVQTPINLMIYASDRMAIPLVNQDFTDLTIHLMKKGTAKIRQFLGQDVNMPTLETEKFRLAKVFQSGDEKAINDAVGRMTIAVGSIGMVGGAVAAGVVTGKGPDNKDERALLEQTGWQPYSIKVGDAYVSYRRLDPFATMIGWIADAYDYAKYDEVDPANSPIGEMSEAIAISLMTQLKSKSYLEGLSTLFDVLDDPVRATEKSAGNILGNLSPNILAGAIQAGAEHRQEINGIMDRIGSRFGAGTGGVRRNVLGEPVVNTKGFGEWATGFQSNFTKSDTINDELASLAYPLSPMSPHKYGMDLRDVKSESGQTAYDRWQQRMSEIRIGGRSLRSAMQRLINSRRYRRIPKIPLTHMDIDDPHVVMIRSLISKYRRRAERDLLKEFPQLAEASRMQRMFRADLLSGRDPQTDNYSLFR